MVNDVDDLIYVGSTVKQYLSERMGTHRFQYNKPEHTGRKLYEHMKTIGIGHFKLIRLESYPCKSKDELRAREQFWKEKLNPQLNSITCYIPPENRKAVKLAQTKKSHQRPEYIARCRQKMKCLCGGKTTHEHRARHFRSKKHTAWSIDHGELNTYEKCFTKIE